MSAEYNCEGCGVPVVWMAPTPAAMSCMCVICLWCNEHIDPCEIVEVRRRCEPGGWTPERLLIEGIASQMRKAQAPDGPIPWWHQTSDAERDRWRNKARNHIAQLGWE